MAIVGVINTGILHLAAFFSLGLTTQCGENAKLLCYGIDGGTGQNIDPKDIAYVGRYLRYLGSEPNTPLFWTMPPKDFECGEWTLPVSNAGTVLALAKHINPNINSSVTYEDIARTIDGGSKEASEKDKANSLLGTCGGNGSQLGVVVDRNANTYNTDEYLTSKAKPKGIIVKLIQAPDP